MDDVFKVALTAVFGIFVYVVGKLIERAWIEPILDVRKTIGEIAFALLYYDNVSATTAEAFARIGRDGQGQAILDAALEGQRYVRERAGHLKSKAYAVPSSGYRLAVALRLLPPVDQIERATSELIGCSNAIAASNYPDSYKDRDRRKREITEALDLERTWGARTRQSSSRPWWRRLPRPSLPSRRPT